MAITPPNFKKDAIPTPQGWRDPRTNELLVSRPISQTQIDEYLNVETKAEVKVLKESPTTAEEAEAELMDDDDLEGMTKIELEALGREHGIELDRRKNKADLIEELKEVI
mgnify:CR=1 FL=1|tara:strand:+ start:9182 stop:9511 length:330 start_codon:yes stop_codon:yes gene_type:complete